MQLPHLNREGKHERIDESQHADRVDAAIKLLSITRSLKPFDECSDTIRAQRLSILRQVARGLGVPESMIESTSTRPDPNLFYPLPDHKVKAVQHAVAVPALSTRQLHRTMHAGNDGTTTCVRTLWRDDRGESVHFSYLTDPVRFLTRWVLRPGRGRIAIGGDKGSTSTKIGVTFELGVRLCFAPLLIFTGVDDYDGLSLIEHATHFQFEGDTELSSYAAVFQWLIDEHGAVLNGDWAFLNTILGLSTASSTFGCCICTGSPRELSRGAQRTPQQLSDDHNAMLADANGPAPDRNHGVMRWPLLTIAVLDVAPLPLHIFLGLGNLIIGEVYRAIVGDTILERVLKSARSERAEGFGGASRVFGLTGPELSTWNRRRLGQQLISDTPRVRFTIGGASAHVAALDRSSARHRIETMERWLVDLESMLLSRKEFSNAKLDAFHALQVDIWSRWREITQRDPTPKVHMLAHAYDFALRHRRLGFFSESRIEASHAAFNFAYNHTHRNASQQPAARLRRTHVTLVLDIVAEANCQNF